MSTKHSRFCLKHQNALAPCTCKPTPSAAGKPCPFCGGLGVLLETSDFPRRKQVWIQCNECGAQSPRFPYYDKDKLGADKAWSAWSKRHSGQAVDDPASVGLTAEGERIAPIQGDPPCNEYDPAGEGAGVEYDGQPQCAQCGYAKALHTLPCYSGQAVDRQDEWKRDKWPHETSISTVDGVFIGHASTPQDADAITDAHNAALAAERKFADGMWRRRHELASEITRLHQQLAVERQRAEQAERGGHKIRILTEPSHLEGLAVCGRCDGGEVELETPCAERMEQQLLSALAAIEKHNKFVREFPDDPAYEIELDEAMK